jgi:hypothetical protein
MIRQDKALENESQISSSRLTETPSRGAFLEIRHASRAGLISRGEKPGTNHRLRRRAFEVDGLGSGAQGLASAKAITHERQGAQSRDREA